MKPFSLITGGRLLYKQHQQNIETIDVLTSDHVEEEELYKRTLVYREKVHGEQVHKGGGTIEKVH